MKQGHRRRGFTLIELMVVIAIILVLAALGVAGLGFVNERQAKEKARIDIALLSKAIEEYKLDMGTYPGIAADTPVNGLISGELYGALFLEGFQYTQYPANPPANWNDKATKIYLPQLDPRNSKQSWVERTNNANPSDSLLVIKDPWGRAYRYRKGDNAQNPDFDLWSTGKDGRSTDANPSLNQPGNADDIRNF